MPKTKDLAIAFLASVDIKRFSPRIEKVACLIAEGKSYKDIASIFGENTKRGRQVYNKVRRVMLREMRQQAALAEVDSSITSTEVDSLIADLKAAHKPLNQISIEGLFPVPMQIRLHASKVHTLDDAVKKGRYGLLRLRKFGEVDIKTVEAILLRFDVILPD
jgi:hypothetical protein